MKKYLHHLNLHMLTLLCVIAFNSLTAQNEFTIDANFPENLPDASANYGVIDTDVGVPNEVKNSANMNTAKTSSPVISFSGSAVDFVEEEGVFEGALEVSEFANCSVLIRFNEDVSSATNYTDFEYETIEILFESTSENRIFDFYIYDDLIFEGNETINLELFEVTGGCTINPDAKNYTVTLIDNENTEVDEFTQNGIELYTAYDELILNLEAIPSSNMNFNLMDITGKLVYHANISSAQNKFQLSDLTTGLYIAQVIADGKTFEKKVFIQ